MDEAARIARLRELALDRIKQPDVFAKITRLASDLFGCPIAIVSIIDEHEQWFLGKRGLEDDRVPREHTLCSSCLESGEPMRIDDASRNPKFRTLPGVRADGGLRSNLGVPLTIEDGTLIGTVCCASPKVAAFGPNDIAKLTILTELAEQCINAHAKTVELARVNTSLDRLNRLFKQAEQAAQIGSWRVDLSTNELHWSDQVFAIHGVALGTPVDVDTAVQFYEPADRPVVEQTLKKVKETGEPFSFEATIKRQDGELRRIRARGERIEIDGVAESVAGVFMDCTEDYQRTQALQKAASSDALTGLCNRNRFDQRLVKALGERAELGADCPLTVMLLDLDGFKDVNDTLGHLAGDRLLTQIAKALQGSLGKDSLIARWGGDEFAVLFPVGCAIDDALAMANHTIQDIAGRVSLGERIIPVSATCGLAEIRSSVLPEELIRRADLALYHGKANARGIAHCWSEQIETIQAARHRAVTTLTDGLNSGRAFAMYHAIVDLELTAVVGVEALVRLRDENGYLVSAATIAPALTDPVLARRVSRHMMDEIKRDASGLLAHFGPDTRIGLNVSEADLGHDDFVAQIEGLIRDSVLEPDNIVLEVTETMLLLDETGHIRSTLHTLDERGFTIALDDFGTGFSSLTHLRDFPIRKVKIDKDFIASMAHNHQSRLIVQAMVQMGQSLDIRMVAEGVETEEQYQFLRSIGCSHAQGFLFHRPVTLEELLANGEAGGLGAVSASGPSKGAPKDTPQEKRAKNTSPRAA
ncbi:MAG: EAL domain-containing protein [Pseudomonadota bacterium]